MFKNYLRTAIGNLRRNMLYAAVSISCLAVGICVAVVVAIYVVQETRFDDFVPEANRTVLVAENIAPPGNGSAYRTYPGSPSILPLAQLRLPEIEAGDRVAPAEVLIEAGNAPVQEETFAWADADTLAFFKLKMVAGNPLTASSAPDGVAITRAFARRYFGQDRPLGRILTIRTVEEGAGSRAAPPPGPPHALRVTAVVEDLPETANLRLEALASGSSSGSPLRQDSGARFVPSDQISYTFLRLRPGAAVSAVQSRLNDALRDYLASPGVMGGKVLLELTPVRDVHLPVRKIDNPGPMAALGDRLVIKAVLIVAGLVLITACVNFVGLTTARATKRVIEVGVRKAMGATQGQIIAQFLGESFIQTALATALALAMAELALPAFNSLAGRAVTVDLQKAWLWAGLLGLAVVVGLGSGLYPALILSGFRPAAALKGEPFRMHGGAGVREVLVMVQFAVLVVLIIAVVVFWRQGESALRQAEQLGGQHILWVSEPGVCEGGFKDALAKDPEVLDLACASPIALQNGGAATAAVTVRGDETTLEMGMVDTRFLQFYGAKVLAGRLFEDRYGSDIVLARPDAAVDAAVAPSVVLNAAAARKLGYRSPSAAVGAVLTWTRLNWPKGQGPHVRKSERSRIVGVVGDIKLGLNREAIRPMVYWVDPAFFSRMSVRTRSADLTAFGERVDSLWIRTGHVRPPRREWVDQAVRRVYRDVTSLDVMVSICAALALLIAGVGIFTLAAFTAERRRKEIGVRKALGAARSDILNWLLWQFAEPVLLSTLISWPIAWLGLRAWLSHFPDQAPMGLDLFLASTVAALLVAFLAVAGCAWKTSSQKPALAIRCE